MNAKAKTTLENERFRIMIAWYCNEECEPNSNKCTNTLVLKLVLYFSKKILTI